MVTAKVCYSTLYMTLKQWKINIMSFAFRQFASIHAYMIVLPMKYDGNLVIKNEPEVKLYLEHILKFHEQFSMKAYHRKAISHKVKKTEATTHSFYIISDANNNYHTLNFSATGKFAISKGAWALDTDADITSYENYMAGNNIWSIAEITTKNGIDTQRTIENVLRKMNGNTTYFYLSQINRNKKHDNCNTALYKTLVEKADGD
jgi:hypothetical protein